MKKLITCKKYAIRHSAMDSDALYHCNDTHRSWSRELKNAQLFVRKGNATHKLKYLKSMHCGWRGTMEIVEVELKLLGTAR